MPRNDTLTTNFDKEKDQYYIEQEIVLAPKEVRTLEVEVKDVWVVPQERISSLKEVCSREYAVGRNQNKTAAALKDAILKNLDVIAQSQEQNTVAMVGVERHIHAYEENVKALKTVEADIQVLKNLVGRIE